LLFAQPGCWNGDGIPDILAEAGEDLAISLGEGHGVFAAPFYVGTGPLPGPIVLESLHGQPAGFPDIVLADSSGYVYTFPNITKQ